MSTTWDHLPVEMMQAIVEKLDSKTRVKLSMCSKFEYQLVRSTKRGEFLFMVLVRDSFKIFFLSNSKTVFHHCVTLKLKDDGGCKVYVNQEEPKDEDIETYSTRDWKETILYIMSVLGTKVKIGLFEVETDRLFKERFNWLRKNIYIEPENISIDMFSSNYDESIFDWPSTVSYILSISSDELPNLERFNTYEKIDWFSFKDLSENGDAMTDEDLKKLKNARTIKLYPTGVTLDGFHWWITEWFKKKDDDYAFGLEFKEHQLSMEHFKSKMSDVIGKSEPFFEGEGQCWNIEKNENVKSILVVQIIHGIVYFESSIKKGAENENKSEKASVQVVENGSNNYGAIEQVAENENLLINDELIDRDVEMGNVPRRKKSFKIIIICLLHLFTFFLPLAFILIFCLIFEIIKF